MMSSRKLVVLEHVSLDGFVAGPSGEMDWIRVEDDELWDDVSALTARADTAIFGRTTYEMMASYWPTAREAPGATSTISTTVAGSTRPPYWRSPAASTTVPHGEHRGRSGSSKTLVRCVR